MAELCKKGYGKLHYEISTDRQNKFRTLWFYETIIYHLFFWSAVAYSLCQFYFYSKALAKQLPLSPKKSFFGTQQDQNDLEWNIFVPLLVEFLPYGLFHLFLSQLIRKFYPQILPAFYISFSICFLLKIFGITGSLLCLSIPLLMYVSLFTKMRVVVWLCWCCILILFNTEYFSHLLIMWLGDFPDAEYKCSVIAAWIILRSLSFSLDFCEGNDTRPSFSLLMRLLAYCFYFPLVLTGPFMPFSTFQDGLKNPTYPWTAKRIFWLFTQLARFAFWAFLADTLLYYFYAHCLQYPSLHVSKMNSWAMAGFVYFLIIFFLLKYVVYYGWMAVFARAEGVDVPPHPKCVLLVSCFSDVWRHFDNGLYLFMTKHIYIPFLGYDRSALKKLQASAVVFTFVYIWHGASPNVFWWSAFNFLGVLLERSFSALSRQEQIFFQLEKLSENGRRRLDAFFSGTLILLSTVSLVIFLSSIENAATICKRIFIEGFPATTVTCLLAFYCVAQCGVQMNAWRQFRDFNKVE